MPEMNYVPAQMLSNMRSKLCYTRLHYDRLCSGSCKYSRSHLRGSLKLWLSGCGGESTM
jgi:hypothetical protein